MLEHYFIAKKIVSSKYKEDDPNYSLFVTAIYCLLEKYPDEESIIQELFQKTSIYIEDDTLENILTHHSISLDCFFGEEDTEENDFQESYAASSFNHNFVVISGVEIQYIDSNPFIACSLKVNNPTILLNGFLHEMNHLVKGYYNGWDLFQSENEVGYHIRSGISDYYYRYCSSDSTIHEVLYDSILDEVINTIETTEMLKTLPALRDILEEEPVHDFLSSLDEDLLQNDYGYEECVSVFRPLWENRVFQGILGNKLLTGETDAIQREFDIIQGKGAFEKLADDLDELDAYCSILGSQSFGIVHDKAEAIKNHIQNIIHSFMTHSDKMNVK